MLRGRAALQRRVKASQAIWALAPEVVVDSGTTSWILRGAASALRFLLSFSIAASAAEGRSIVLVNPLPRFSIDSHPLLSKMFETFGIQIVSNIIGDQCITAFHLMT